MTFNLIPDDPIIGQLTPYSVGWLREERDHQNRRRFVPSGSGVLVEIGGIRGVLTAGHVVHALEERGGDTGTALFTIVRKEGKARRLEFQSGECQCLRIGGLNDDPAGPDLGFVRVPHLTEQRLIDENLFYNFDVRLKAATVSVQDETPLRNDVIVGLVAENSQLKQFTETTRIDTHTMVHDYGVKHNFRIGNDGLDIFDLVIAHNENVAQPYSYGGLSGAGVWVVGDEPGTNQRALVGIAFHETATDENGSRLVICHGPHCIHRELVDELQKRFRDFKLPTNRA